jgi:hypothetical protein
MKEGQAIKIKPANQCIGSGLEPDSITSVDLDPDPGGQELPTKAKSSEISCFFFSLENLYGGLGKHKLQFWINKILTDVVIAMKYEKKGHTLSYTPVCNFS